jgi:hypothetical protein
MRGAILPLPNTPPWCGVQVKSTGTTLLLPLPVQKDAEPDTAMGKNTKQILTSLPT